MGKSSKSILKEMGEMDYDKLVEDIFQLMKSGKWSYKALADIIDCPVKDIKKIVEKEELEVKVYDWKVKDVKQLYDGGVSIRIIAKATYLLQKEVRAILNIPS